MVKQILDVLYLLHDAFVIFLVFLTTYQLEFVGKDRQRLLTESTDAVSLRTCQRHRVC